MLRGCPRNSRERSCFALGWARCTTPRRPHRWPAEACSPRGRLNSKARRRSRAICRRGGRLPQRVLTSVRWVAARVRSAGGKSPGPPAEGSGPWGGAAGYANHASVRGGLHRRGAGDSREQCEGWSGELHRPEKGGQQILGGEKGGGVVLWLCSIAPGSS